MNDGNDPTSSNTGGNGAGRDDPVDSIPVPYAESFETLVYHPGTGSYRTRFDAGIDTPSMAVVSAVAAVAGVAITDLDPLHDIVDPDALDRLWSSPGIYDQNDSRLSFTFADYEVTLSRHGEISIGEQTTDATSVEP